MRSPYYFIIKPKGEKHISSKNVGGMDLIVNGGIDDHNYVNRIAEVVSTPIDYNGDIEPKDLIVVHHNTFRKYRTQQGDLVESFRHIKGDLFYTDNPLMVIKENEVKSVDPYIFLKQVENDNDFDKNEKHNNVGVICVNSTHQEANGFKKGEYVIYENFRNYEFDVLGEKLIKMDITDIVGKI